MENSMTVNWEKFQSEIDEIIEESATKTNKKLAGKISNVTRLTDSEVKRLFSDPADVKKLAGLMEIVKRSGDKNEKINEIVANAEEFGGIIFALLKKLA